MDTSSKIQKEINFPHSLGLLYAAFTYYTGFKVNSGEYKVMGLAPFGTPKYTQLIYDHLIDLKPDGSFRLNLDYFNFCTGLTMTNERFNALFGGPPRKPEMQLEQRDMDLAASIQTVLEEAVLRLTRSLAEETGEKNLCLAGGVALNCVANGKVRREGRFENIWIQPAAGDCGAALGAALTIYHLYADRPRTVPNLPDGMVGSYLGPEFDDGETQTRLKAAGARFATPSRDQLLDCTARALADGKAVGWFQGRMEFGPRALGNRSILGDPRDPEMQKKLNLKVKYRESFRPFAPSVLREQVAEWFDINVDSPYMLIVANVLERHRREITSEEQKLHGVRQTECVEVERSRGHARGLFCPRADRAPRDQSALPRSYQPFSRADRMPRTGQHQLQRAQRADRMHARGCLPLLHGHRNRGIGGRELLSG